MEFNWEDIYERDGYPLVNTWRAKVIGGWIVCNHVGARGDVTQGMVFVPDPLHEWEIEECPTNPA